MSPGKYVGSDPLDLYLGHCLNHWLDQYSPPASAKAQLMLTVSSTSLDQKSSVSFLGLAALVIRRGFRVLSYIMSEPQWLESRPSNLAMVFVSTMPI